MDTSLERIRAKIAELEAKLADLRIAERELVALGPAPARKSTAARTPKVNPKRKGKGPSPASPTIGAAIAEVLHEQGSSGYGDRRTNQGGRPRDPKAKHLLCAASA